MTMLTGFREFLFESHGDIWSRLAQAADPATSPKELARLSQESSNLVRAAVASNERTPVSILFILSQDEVETVARYARKNPNFSDDVSDFLFAEF